MQHQHSASSASNTGRTRNTGAAPDGLGERDEGGHVADAHLRPPLMPLVRGARAQPELLEHVHRFAVPAQARRRQHQAVAPIDLAVHRHRHTDHP